MRDLKKKIKAWLITILLGVMLISALATVSFVLGYTSSVAEAMAVELANLTFIQQLVVYMAYGLATLGFVNGLLTFFNFMADVYFKMLD